MTTTAQTIAAAIGFDAHAVTEHTLAGEYPIDYVVIDDGQTLTAYLESDIVEWADAGGGSYQDLCDAMTPIANDEIAVDYYRETYGILCGVGGSQIMTEEQLDDIVFGD